jgi:hypothetical protein
VLDVDREKISSEYVLVIIVCLQLNKNLILKKDIKYHLELSENFSELKHYTIHNIYEQEPYPIFMLEKATHLASD